MARVDEKTSLTISIEPLFGETIQVYSAEMPFEVDGITYYPPKIKYGRGTNSHQMFPMVWLKSDEEPIDECDDSLYPTDYTSTYPSFTDFISGHLPYSNPDMDI